MNGNLLVAAVLVAACGSTVSVPGGTSGGGTSEGGAASMQTTSNTATTMTSSSSGMLPECEELDQAGCETTAGCVPHYDWRPVVDNAPPPPPGTPPEDPCCPECMTPKCSGCHIPVYSWCLADADCGQPLPDDVCGFPEDDCP